MIEPGMKLGPFVIEKEVGSGAMGTVYRAQFKDKKQRVAIKVMVPGTGSSATAQARFQRESEILKQLKHPNIVRLLATGRFKTSPFYAMEYIDGEPLDKVLLRRGRLSWEEVVELGQQLCAGLQHAHEQGIVHRDLKPGNLMILPDGTVKLTDFGIAKDLDLTGLTATNCTVGTASYMSPEQCRGEKELSSRSDLYSMGVMFYELLTGRKPFKAESVMDMFVAHSQEVPERPSRFVENVPVWMDNLIMQLLEKKPAERPLNAQKVAELLAQIKEKVEAQQSAGVERARARAIDRPKGGKLDESDKDAARALLGKKKKKKKKIPFYQKGWFVSVAVAAVLLALGGLLYWVFVVPPSLESLYQQTAELVKKGDLEGWQAAKDGPLATFLTYYKDQTSERAKQMHAWLDEADVRVAEAGLLRDRERGLPPDDSGESLALRALDREDEGRLEEARKAWARLAEQIKDKEDRKKRAWGLVAQKQLTHHNQLRQSLADFDARVKADDSYTGKEDEQLAVLATRAEIKLADEADDAAKAKWRSRARQYWQELKQRTERTRDRFLYLMAASHLRELNALQPTAELP